jgi:hypothetical protein
LRLERLTNLKQYDHYTLSYKRNGE